LHLQPEFWPNGLGGWGSNGKWKAGFEAYAQWFHKVALAINPCGSKKMLSGPGWGELYNVIAAVVTDVF
jgi:hypothetical protein